MNTDKRNYTDYKNSELIKLALGEKKDLYWIFITSSAVNVLFLTPMIYMLQIFDRIFISKSVFTLLTISIVILFFYTISAIGNYIRSNIVIGIGIKIERKINERLFKAAFQNKLIQNNDNPTAYQDDITLVRQWFTGNGIFTVFDFPWIPIYLFVMFLLHPILGLLAAFLIVCYLIAGLSFSKILGKKDDLIREEEMVSNEYIYDKLRHNASLKVYGLSQVFKDSWLEIRKKFYVNFSHSEALTGRVFHGLKQFRFFTASLALGTGAILVISDQLTLASMIAAALLMSRTIAPADMLVGAVTRINLVRESFWRIEELLKICPENGHHAQDVEIVKEEVNASTIKIVNLGVSYGEDITILENINLTINGGEILGIVGENGVGKTTFTKALAGLLPYSGNILYDDREVRRFAENDFGHFIGYFPQAIAFFPTTIAKNISCLKEPNSERIVEVAKIIGIHELILRLPYGYETVLEGGFSFLSGGERQKIGLARAIYNNPRCVILDEPNAFLDMNGEAFLFKVLRSLREEGKIIILVSHRSSILKLIDRIIEIKDRKINQMFTKEELEKNRKSADELSLKFS